MYVSKYMFVYFKVNVSFTCYVHDFQCMYCIALHRQRRIVGYSIRRQETEPTHRLAWTFRHDYQRGKLIMIQQNVMYIKLTSRKVMTMFRLVITKNIHTNIHSYIHTLFYHAITTYVSNSKYTCICTYVH